jgi:hypothetical protein
MRRRAARFFIGVCLMSGLPTASEGDASSAPAEHRAVRLSYVRESGAEQCPDESVLRESVLGRLGYDPFDDRAPTLLTVTVRPAERSLLGRIELRDASGRVQGERDLRGAGTDCAELAVAMAIAISIGIDPLSAMATKPPSLGPSVESSAPASLVPIGAPPQTIVVSPPETPSPPAPDHPSSRTPSPIQARFSAGALASWGISPAAPAVGATLSAGVRRGRWSLDLEGGGSWAATATDGAYGATSSLEIVSLAPCVHFGVGLACALGGVGSMGATGVVRFPETSHALFADLGVRLGAEVPFAHWFYVQFHADGLGILTPETFYVGQTKFWTTSPPVCGSLGVAIGVVP